MELEERRRATVVEVIRLSREAQEQFVSMLMDPPQPTDAFLRALGRHDAQILE